MFYIQVPKQKAVIQPLASEKQPKAKQGMKLTQEKPAKQEFKSIFTLLWGSYDTVQRMDNGSEEAEAEYIDEIGYNDEEIPLVKDRLNVVGEAHEISNLRREDEEEYTKLYIDSTQYWREANFPNRNLTSDEISEMEKNPNLFRDPRKKADSYKLRFLFVLKKDIISMVEELTEYYDGARQLTKLDDSYFKEGEEKKLVNGFMSTLKSMERWITQLAYLVEWLRIDAAEYEEEEEKIFRSLGNNEIKNIARTRKNTYEKAYDVAMKNGYKNFTAPTEIETNWVRERGRVISTQAYYKLGNIYPVLDEMIVKANPKNLKASIDDLVSRLSEKKLIDDYDFRHQTWEDISRDRSDTMHIAANNQWNTKGVWKIGEQHVQDLKRKYSEDIKYNLVTQDEFENHFSKYLKLKDKVNKSDFSTRL